MRPKRYYERQRLDAINMVLSKSYISKELRESLTKDRIELEDKLNIKRDLSVIQVLNRNLILN